MVWEVVREDVGTGDGGFGVGHSVPLVHFGQKVGQLVAVALGQTAHYYQTTLATIAGMAAVEELFGFYLLENGVDGLFFGVTDEAAGINDDHIGIVLLVVEKDLVSGVAQ